MRDRDSQIIEYSLRHPEAFAEIFDRHHGEIHNFLRRRVGVEIADDLVADTFLRAFSGRSRFIPIHESCRPWLYGIATHLVANHRRAETRRLKALVRQRADAATGPDVPSGHVDTSGPVADAVRHLRHRDREVLLLYAWADLSYEEIAEALDLPIGTVRSRLNRARTQIRGRLTLATAPPPAHTPARPGEAHVP